jgi:hypothetical protein
MLTKLLKGSRFGSWLVAALCVFLMTATTPRKAAAQGITEYGAILAFVATLVGLVFTLADEGPPNANALQLVAGKIDTDVKAAAQAFSDGDRPKEIGELSKAIGHTQALIGLTSSCDSTCDGVRRAAQDIIGQATCLKSNAIQGVSNPCHD